MRFQNAAKREEIVKETTTKSKEKEASTTTAKAPAPKESFTMTKGHYYMVVGVFRSMNNSMSFTKDLKSKGYPVNVSLNPKNNLYYVYIRSTKDRGEAVKIRNEYRWKNLFKEAWVFKME
jgi:cell division septation protein DedD